MGNSRKSVNSKRIFNKKSIVVIKSEGKTEQTYFENFKSRDCIIKYATGNKTDPLGMLDDLLNYVNNEDITVEDGDKIYLVIDSDVDESKQGAINEVIKKCKDTNIELIISTPTFEYWFILHFKRTSKIYCNSQDVKDDLKNFIPDYKEGKNVFHCLAGKLEKAIKNAESIEKFQIENDSSIYDVNCNPYTRVYVVVKELLIRN